ncbi:radical SAM/SPASM domain-containing protein [Candidatus Uhrbacteria bacterium]|nr:radical SAM/SPASM domain-containing protein [Candidatus Uhrbacteria bacterium]
MYKGAVWTDPNLQRKEKIMVQALDQQAAVYPPVSLFEISVTGLCNRKCPFCPRVDPEVYPNVNEYISPHLHTKMMRELGELDYQGLIVYSGYSEPLLHKELDKLVEEARQCCTKAKIEIYTNGDFLNVDAIHNLFKAGVSSIHVSLYDGPHQVEYFSRMREEAGVTDKQLVLRERYLLDQGAGMHLSNRAGTIDFERMNLKPLAQPLSKKCYLPFYMMMIDHTGEVFLCSHDWVKKYVVGDLNKETIIEVWNGLRLKAARESLTVGDRGFGPCAKCDVDGTKIGRKHFEEWSQYYNRKF